MRSGNWKRVYLGVLVLVTLACIIVGSLRFVEAHSFGEPLPGMPGTERGNNASSVDEDITETFNGVTFDASLTNVTIESGGSAHISYSNGGGHDERFDYAVKDGVLHVSQTTETSLRELKRTASTITITIPETVQLRDLSGVTALGDVRILDVNVRHADVSTNMGNLSATRLGCVSCSLRSDMGTVSASDVSFGDSMELSANMGNVELSGVENLRELRLELSTSMGGIMVNGQRSRADTLTQGTGTRRLVAKADMGDVRISSREGDLDHG